MRNDQRNGAARDPELQILSALARTGSANEAGLPTRWPLVRMHVPVVIDRLLASGWVRCVAYCERTMRRTVVITAAGRAVVASSLAGSHLPGDPRDE
jgi:hypothetical protein